MPPPQKKKYNTSLDPNYLKANSCCKSSDISRNGVIFFIRMFMNYMFLMGIGLFMANKYPFWMAF